jgi:hypothetical protein
MKRVAYISTAAHDFGDGDWEALSMQSSRDNAAAGVNGLLAFNGLNFLQVLEGEAEDIDPLLRRILVDSRHAGVVMLVNEKISTREFAAFSTSASMDRARATAELLDEFAMPMHIRHLFTRFPGFR